jgi:hypothetical protein
MPRQTSAPSGTLSADGDVVKWFNTEVCKTSIHRFESGRRLHFLSRNPVQLGGLLRCRAESGLGCAPIAAAVFAVEGSPMRPIGHSP